MIYPISREYRLRPIYVLLVDVAEAHAREFEAWCGPRDIEVVRASLDFPGPSPADVALCVWSILANEDDVVLERGRNLFKEYRHCPLVALAPNLRSELAFRLAGLGVLDVIALPLQPDELVVRAMSHFANSGQTLLETPRLTGQSPQIRRIREELRRGRGQASTVLIQGETGTGKGVLAREIHGESDRRDEPFVHVDCASLSIQTIESELLGHEKGAFPGASRPRRGRFEAAEGGTVFLDEIADLDLELQSRLLRVLSERTFERVGGGRALPMRARVIAASCHPLQAAVSRGSFRRELYYRLNVLHFELPPLRDRLDDIPLLVRAGFDELARRLQISAPRATRSFYDRLQEHTWPGNVRELFNLLERLLVSGRGEELAAEDLDGILESQVVDVPEDESSEEALMIEEALLASGGNVSRAARRTGISRSTLRYRIRKLGLQHLIPKD